MRIFGKLFRPQQLLSSEAIETAPSSLLPPELSLLEKTGYTLLQTIAWITAGVGALTLGVLVGREIRLRHRFNRRTPYDFYAHSGDRVPDVDFGLGI